MTIIFLEQISIFVSLLSILLEIFEDNAKEDIKNFIIILQKLTPVNLVKDSLTCSTFVQLNTTICSASNLIIIMEILVTSIIISFLSFFIFEEVFINNRREDNTADKINDKQSFYDCMANFLSFFFVNFLDFVIHFFTLGIFYLNFNEILGFINLLNASNSNVILSNSTNSAILTNFSIINSFIPIISFIFLIFYFYIYISFIKNINLIIQYNKDLSTHYDHIFSTKYDLMLFFLKILISMENSFDSNKIISHKSLTFLKILIIFVFLIFNLYLIFTCVIAKRILYLSNHVYNIFRIFLNNFSFFSLVFIIFFNKIFFQNLHIVYITFFISFIISAFMSIVVNDQNFVAIYSTDNYILQLIYILNVKYNSSEKQLKLELSNIMFHHKNYCMHHKICQICKMDNFEFDNFLHNYYERIKNMNKSKNLRYMNFEKNDINTFDIIRLLIIENLDKNKIIKLIYKARRILEKYEVKKRYDNNYFNILIYNNYMKKLITKNNILKFKIIQCYEDTSLDINKALVVVETMLLSLNNGEKQLFGKSSDLYDLKNKISKNVLFLSYYQNYFVDTYSIIIYRFIYKNLFNCDINDYITIYNFDEIKDLINYMYSNEKLIQIKLNFTHNSMKMLRLGKDLIGYRNKSFDDLIPSEFKDHCCHELIKKVKSSDNEENKSFEYVITDSENNLKSLKINFTILASFKLDEVILIGQYEILKEDLVLVKKLNNSLQISNNTVGLGNRTNFLNNFSGLYGKSYKDNIEYNLNTDTNINPFNINKKKPNEENKENFKNKNNFTNQQKEFKKIPEVNDSEKYSISLSSIDTEIVNFSCNLQKALFIKSNWLSKIKLKYNLPFVDIFERIVTQQKKTEKDENEINIFTSLYKINYDKYFLIYQKLINFVEEEMNNDEIRENLKRFRHILKNNKISYYKFDILYEINIKKKDVSYLLFRTVEVKNFNPNIDHIYNDFPSHSIQLAENTKTGLDNEKDLEMDFDKINNMIKEKETMSVSSGTLSGNNSRSELFMSSNTSRKTIANNDQRMNKFTIFSLIFSIFLVFYCLFFLVMGLINNNNIRKLYLIRNNFNDFRYFFYHTSMNFFFNLGINKNDASFDYTNSNINNINKNSDSLFFQKFKEDKTITINISKYVVEELSVKLNLLRNIYVNLQNAIYSSHYKDSLDIIFNTKSKFLQLNSISNKITVSSTEKYFFETINIFFNHGKVIVDNIAVNNFIYLSIINTHNNNIDFGKFTSDFKLTEVQIKMYEIILNYLTYYKSFIQMGELMNKFFSESLTDVFNSTYLLSFILMGVHIFLFIGGIMIVKFLHKIISQNDKMLCSSNDDENIKFMREKLKSIKNMSLLFVENPKNLVNTINKKRGEYIKKLISEKDNKGKNKLKNSSEEKNDLIDNDYNDDFVDVSTTGEKSKISYLDKFIILIPFVQLFLILFIIYYSYSLFFYFIFRSSYNDFIQTSEFSNQNIDLDNKMMNNINILSTMMILNKTEYDVSEELSGTDNAFMMDMLTNILKIRTDISKYKKTNTKFLSIDDFENNLMNCTYIYTNLNDSIFNEMQKNKEGKLIENLISICNSYKFMKTDRIDSIFDEISYNSLHLYNLYENSDKSYLNITKIYENFMLYDVFLIFMFVFRPIRKFSSDYIYNNIISLSSTNYLVFTIIYLILNILVDLFIFYIMNRMVVKKISDINKHLNNMITCVSFKFSNNNKEKGN